MDIKNFRKRYKLSNSDMIRVIQYRYPRFCKYALFMCTNSKGFGVQLTAGAEDALMAAVDKKKPNRKKNHQLTVRVDDTIFDQLQVYCTIKSITVQDAIEDALFNYLVAVR